MGSLSDLGAAYELDSTRVGGVPHDRHAYSEELSSAFSAFHSAPIGLCSLDLHFRYLLVNECFARMYCLPVGALLGRTVAEALPTFAEQIESHLRRALRTGSTVASELSGLKPAMNDQTLTQTFLGEAKPIYGPMGNVVGIAVALLDITERKAAEAALKASEEHLRYTVELNPHMPWTAEPDGSLTFLSRRWYETTGMKPSPAGLQDWTLSLHPTDRSRTLEAWRTSVTTGQDFDDDHRIRRGDGSWCWHKARAYPRRDTDGQIVRWYGTLEDIHARKMAEETLRAKTARVEEATGELERGAWEDHLTGLANRRAFDSMLTREIHRAHRSKLPLTLIMVDVDHFEKYNDTCGQTAGDEVLRRVAQTLGNIIQRPGDLVARFGVEEFAFVLPNTPLEGGLVIANRAADRVRSLRLGAIGRHIEHVTVSVGLASLDVQAPLSAETVVLDLVRAASEALCKARSEGRDRVVASICTACATDKSLPLLMYNTPALSSDGIMTPL